LLEGERPAEYFLASATLPGASASVGVSVRVTDSPDFTLVTARVAGAADMDAAAFERCAAEAYTFVADALAARPHRHPVRFWNHIPDIRRCDEGSIDRYMVFNAGRFAACSRWFGGPASFDRLLPTASAVGHAGADLVVHALAGNDPGVAVENPRQVPSYRYSRRFGPRPPCFARATVLPGAGGEGPLVLVAGTASIRGEETVHFGDVRAQTLETFENLSVLVAAARSAVGPAVPAETRAAASAAAGSKARPAQPALRSFEGLQSFRDLRVYYVRPADRSAVRRMVAAALPHLRGVEYVRADLCRPDLLVEIEGTASVPL
jgi:chorismate lyase/3-hydroxybenzoate synthase